ncbi:MAG: hypothetical protein GAK45_00934 [Pseudomonas citronellolis]|nr:MAG: hypothetical protein GAK45_00934 [Pseudomonas citronellolis]
MVGTGLRARVRGEQAALLAAVHFRQLVEGAGQALDIDLALFQQVIGEVVGRGFLGLGELRVDQRFGEFAKLRVGQARYRRVLRRGRRAVHGRDSIGRLQCLACVAEGDVAHFVAEHAFDFVVVHLVHQAAVHADAAIGHGPGVHVLGDVDLVVQRYAIDPISQCLSDALEAFLIGATGCSNGVLLVSFGTGLLGELADIGIAQGRCLECEHAGLDAVRAIEILATAKKKGATGQDG